MMSARLAFRTISFACRCRSAEAVNVERDGLYGRVGEGAVEVGFEVLYVMHAEESLRDLGGVSHDASFDRNHRRVSVYLNPWNHGIKMSKSGTARAGDWGGQKQQVGGVALLGRVREARCSRAGGMDPRAGFFSQV